MSGSRRSAFPDRDRGRYGRRRARAVDLGSTRVVAPIDGVTGIASVQVGDLWIVDEGLTAGEGVVTEGLQKVRDGMVVKPKDAAIVTATTAASEG